MLELENELDIFQSRFEQTEERIYDLEERVIEIIESEGQEEKKIEEK